MSFLRLGAFASGSGMFRFGETLPSLATANSLMLPLTLLRKMREPSGEKMRPVKLNWPVLSTGSGGALGVPDVAAFGSDAAGVAGFVPVAAAVAEGLGSVELFVSVAGLVSEVVLISVIGFV